MNLLDSITKNLPKNPSEAILLLAARIEEKIIEPETHVGTALEYRAIARFIVRFCEKFDLPINFKGISVAGIDLDDEGDALNFLEKHVEALQKFESSLEDRKADAEIENLLSKYETALPGEVFGLARLNADEKKKVHAHLQKIRTVISESALSDRKKNALFDRVNGLAKEVDAHGTQTDRFFAFAGDVGFVLGDMAKKAKPLLHEVKEVLRIVSRSRARQEGISLPPGDEVLQLAPPEEDAE
jgi:hypothetical protein